MKNTRKLIRKKKWENLGLDMQAEDLMEKTKQFQLLRVTKQLQTFIKGTSSLSTKGLYKRRTYISIRRRRGSTRVRKRNIGKTSRTWTTITRTETTRHEKTAFKNIESRARKRGRKRNSRKTGTIFVSLAHPFSYLLLP